MPSWHCPEDDRVVVAGDVRTIEEAVRIHFTTFPHSNVELVGFTDDGPVLASGRDVPMPASALMHHHGWCGYCRASRASADIDQGESFCPRCGTSLEDTTLHEPHPPVESREAG